jgi:hypothetical protein
MYRYEARSVEGFVQQLAVGYVARGYRFYVSCRIPPDKDPVGIDRKLVERYGLDISKYVRCRRRRQGEASVQYLRHGRFFVLIATPGHHPFFEREHDWRDIREHPLSYGGYSIGSRRGQDARFHASVRIGRRELERLAARVDRIALVPDIDRLFRFWQRLRFEPYAPIRRQLFRLFWRMNDRRKAAGLELVPVRALRMQRRPLSPFVRCPAPTDSTVRGNAVSGLQEPQDDLPDEPAHLRPADAVQGGGVDVAGQGHRVRPCDEASSIDDVGNRVQGDHHLGTSVADHGGDGIGPGIGGPGCVTVMEVVEAHRRDLEDASRDLLAEGGHQAQVRTPAVPEAVEKFRRLNTSIVEREVIRAGEESDQEFLGPGVRVLPQPDPGMGEVLSRVVGDDADDLDLSGEGRFEEFAQEVEPTIEAAEDDHPRPTLGLPR